MWSAMTTPPFEYGGDQATVIPVELSVGQICELMYAIEQLVLSKGPAALGEKLSKGDNRYVAFLAMFVATHDRLEQVLNDHGKMPTQ